MRIFFCHQMADIKLILLILANFSRHWHLKTVLAWYFRSVDHKVTVNSHVDCGVVSSSSYLVVWTLQVNVSTAYFHVNHSMWVLEKSFLLRLCMEATQAQGNRFQKVKADVSYVEASRHWRSKAKWPRSEIWSRFFGHFFLDSCKNYYSNIAQLALYVINFFITEFWFLFDTNYRKKSRNSEGRKWNCGIDWS